MVVCTLFLHLGNKRVYYITDFLIFKKTSSTKKNLIVWGGGVVYFTFSYISEVKYLHHLQYIQWFLSAWCFPV